LRISLWVPSQPMTHSRYVHRIMRKRERKAQNSDPVLASPLLGELAKRTSVRLGPRQLPRRRTQCDGLNDFISNPLTAPVRRRLNQGGFGRIWRRGGSNGASVCFVLSNFPI
jgi:hypothetical protein